MPVSECKAKLYKRLMQRRQQKVGPFAFHAKGSSRIFIQAGRLQRRPPAGRKATDSSRAERTPQAGSISLTGSPAWYTPLGAFQMHSSSGAPRSGNAEGTDSSSDEETMPCSNETVDSGGPFELIATEQDACCTSPVSEDDDGAVQKNEAQRKDEPQQVVRRRAWYKPVAALVEPHHEAW